jgi:Transposase DDE domain
LRKSESSCWLAAREEKQPRTGKKPGGRPPEPPSGAVGAKEQINLTDEDSRIMPAAGGGFDQSYNAQAVVAAESLLVVAPAVTQAANDKEQLLPMLSKLAELPEELGRAERLLADSGYLSEKNVESCAAAGVEPLIAFKRERHHPTWRQRFAAAPKPPPESATAMQKMMHRLKTPEGRELYGLRKQTPEPVFGIIKSVMGFRQFLLRGLESVQGEWSLVTLSWNLRRMFALQPS